MLARARGNWLSSYAVTIAYLKHSGQSITDWGAFMGRQYTNSWASKDMSNALKAAEAVGVNPIAAGGAVIAIDGDEKQATITFELPISTYVKNVDVDLDEFDQMVVGMYSTIFNGIGFQFSSSHDGARWTFQLTQPE